MNRDSNKFIDKTTISVDENQTVIRLDLFLFDKMPNVTRNKIQEGIKEGQVLVNNKKVTPSYKVKPNDKQWKNKENKGKQGETEEN